MDGYLTGAKVCLDLNGNGACDSQEPSTTSGVKGAYSLSYPTTVNTSGLYLLAEVNAGAVDADQPATPLTAPYKLMTPISGSSVISPLTTAVSGYMKVGNPIDTAQSLARTNFGLHPLSDLMKDYVATNDSTLKTTAVNFAKQLAGMVGSNPIGIQNLNAALMWSAPFITVHKSLLDPSGSANGAGIGGDVGGSPGSDGGAIGGVLVAPPDLGTGTSISYSKTIGTLDFQNPVTIAETQIDYYNLIWDVVPDPSNPSGNSAFRVVKNTSATAGAVIYVGKTGSLFSFKQGNQNGVTVRVWAAAAGIPIRVSAYWTADTSKNIGSAIYQTVGSGWQTMRFPLVPNFSGGTTVFYNYIGLFPSYGLAGSAGGAGVFYFDDVTTY